MDLERGQVQMATLALDRRAFLSGHLASGGDATEDPGAVGHLHLEVGDIETARGFSLDTLGFEHTAEMPGALFFSAGGYHHHVAVNM